MQQFFVEAKVALLSELKTVDFDSFHFHFLFYFVVLLFIWA